MGEVTAGQIALLVASVVLFAAGWGLSLLRIWWEGNEPVRVGSKAAVYGGIVVGLGVLAWHSAARRSWLPLEDNFDALIWLGLLLAGFVAYMQAARPLRGLDWFVLPIVMLLLIFAGIFGATKPHEYNVNSVWLWVHRVTAYGGAAAFAVAGAVGAMYLIVNRRLRSKAAPGLKMGSLERLEHLTLMAVTLGFSLLTIGAITGIARIDEGESGKQIPIAKLILTAVVWLVYAAVLHSPINPSFRGRRAAVLSVLGFLTMVGTMVVVQFMP